MKIICIGRNYADHAKELNDEVPEEPVVFMKPDSAILRKNNPFYIPSFAKEFHHEVELVVRINRIGKNIAPKFANRYFDEIGLGVDFTARDLQNELKAKGLPWEKCKAFDGSAVISDFVKKDSLGDVNNLDFHLNVNGEIRQKGNTSQMIFSIDDIVAYVSKFFTLKIGDLIYSGTPAGVAKVNMEERLEGYIGERKMFDFMVK